MKRSICLVLAILINTAASLPSSAIITVYEPYEGPEDDSDDD